MENETSKEIEARHIKEREDLKRKHREELSELYSGVDLTNK